MSECYDIIVVGAGICGLVTAYKLAHYNVRVLVIDLNYEPGWGVSKGHAAVVHVVQLPFKSLKSRLAKEGNREFLKICDRLGVRYKRTSVLLLATNLIHLLVLPFIYLYLKLNLGDEFRVKMISWRTLRKIEPNVSDKILGAIEIDGYAVVDSFDLIYGLYEFLLANQVQFSFNEKVTGIGLRDELVEVLTSSGKRYLSRFLVNTGGLYADEVAGLIGDDIRFELGKGVLILFHKQVSSRLLSPLTLRPDPKTKGGAIMFTWDGKGLWGPNLRLIEEKEDLSTMEDDFTMIVKKFSKLIKTEPGVPLKIYAGIRPIPPGNDFINKYSEKSRKIIHVLGTESPGFTASPAIARMVLEMLRESGLRLIEKDIVWERSIFERFSDDPRNKCGRIICLCNMVTEREIREAVRRGSKTLQGVIFRTGVCMGLCQGSRCLPDVLEIISDELGVKISDITLRGGGSWIVKKL